MVVQLAQQMASESAGILAPLLASQSATLSVSWLVAQLAQQMASESAGLLAP